MHRRTAVSTRPCNRTTSTSSSFRSRSIGCSSRRSGCSTPCHTAVMVVADQASVLLVFVYARRRVGGWTAVAAAALLLFLGPGWEVILWPFEIGWLISVGAGVACLLALDRHDRRGDIAAAALLAVSLASSGVGVVIAVGIAVEILAVRRRPGDLWIVAAPAVLFGLCGSAITSAAIHAATASASAGLGRRRGCCDAGGGDGPGRRLRARNHVGTAATWRPPARDRRAPHPRLALPQPRPISPRVLTLAAVVGAFWLLTALDRVAARRPLLQPVPVRRRRVRHPHRRRARGRAAPLRAGRVRCSAVAALAAVASNLSVLDHGARYLRDRAPDALGLGRRISLAARPGPGSRSGLPGYPFVRVTVGEYCAAVHDLGSPAAGQTALATSPRIRRMVDAELVAPRDRPRPTRRSRAARRRRRRFRFRSGD